MIGILVAAVITALASIVAFRLSNEDAILEDMAEVMQSVSNETVENAASFLAPAERSAAELAHLAETGVFAEGSTLAPDRLFYEVLRVHESFDGIFVGGNDGSFLYVQRNLDDVGYTTKEISVDTAGVRTVRNTAYDKDYDALDTWLDPADTYDPRERPWFTLASGAQDGEGVWTDPYIFFSSGRPGVTRAHAGSDGNADEIVVGIDIRIGELSTFIDDRRASENGISFIVDRNRNIVAHPDSSVLANDTSIATTSEVGDPILDYLTTFIDDLDLNGGSRLLRGEVENTNFHFALTSLGNNDEWVIAVTAPDDDFLGRVRDAQRSTFAYTAFGGTASVVALLAGGFVINQRYRNERQLAETALAEAVQRSEERDLARAELTETVHELARSNADLEQYAYATAHDLRTPLRAMGGYAELLMRESEDTDMDPTLRGYTERIVEGYERMCLTMDNLLEHARTSVQHEVEAAVELAPIVEDALSDFDEELTTLGVSVVVGDLPAAAVDPIEMTRVFQNLVSNSIRYRHQDRECVVTIDGEHVGNRSIVRVADNGIGIASADHARVFQLFGRVSSDDAGSGVGLALVKKIVEEHSGTIELESTFGEGATFVISLPSEPEPATPEVYGDTLKA